MSQQHTVGTHATTVSTSGNYTRIVYHSTTVVKFNHEDIILNSGGWVTATTKLRMNQASNQFDLGFRVYQKDYEWFIDYNGKTYDYFDRIRIDRKRKTIQNSQRYMIQ